jgi:galactonate dehydratase
MKHLGHDVVDEVPEAKNGFVDIPSRPGLGMALLPDAQKIRPPVVKPISMRPHFDGFIVDQ